jgi:DNA-binding transcriptional MerR regulator/quercetin dioxygenase-like cupin family protein
MPSKLPVKGPRPEFHFTISQVAQMLNVSSSTLRLWERAGLTKPARTSSGYRLFRLEDIERLKQVHQLRTAENLNAGAIRRLFGSVDRAAQGGQSAHPGSAVEATQSIAGRLRKLRKQRGLKLAEAASQAGLSGSFLSSLERGQANASIATLQKLSALYDTNVLGFFAKSKKVRKLIRPKERKKLSNEPGLMIELLADGETQMEPHMFRIAPGMSSGGSYHHDGEEFVFVVQGTCEFWLDEVDRFRLHPGDSLYFSSHQTHRWKNIGHEEAILLWINTPPTF